MSASAGWMSLQPSVGASVVQFRTLTQARNAFRNDPTNRTAWDYLIKAVEYGAGNPIKNALFLHVVAEVADYIEDSVRAKPHGRKAATRVQSPAQRHLD
jgi:hypothetical protein